MTSIYLLLTIKKVSKKYFYAFSGVLVVSPAWLVRGKLRIPGKAWTISMVLFIVICGLKVGNSFLYIFSRFLSFTEILDTFDFLCLCFFSLTGLFLCASETKKTTTTRRVSIFSEDKETFLKDGKQELTPSSKATPEPRKKS